MNSQITTERILVAVCAILFSLMAFFGSSLWEQVNDNSKFIERLRGEVVTREALNGRLDRIDDRITKLSDVMNEFFRRKFGGQDGNN